MRLACPDCGNEAEFLVKTLQIHIVSLKDSTVDLSEQSRPAVVEVLCDECEANLKFEGFEESLRREVLLAVGAD